MVFDKTEPQEYYEHIKDQPGFPLEFTEELFLIGKLTNDIDIKRSVADILLQNSDQGVYKAFNNRSKFSIKDDRKSRDKNLLLLFKLATISSSLQIAKLYSLLIEDSEVLLYDDLKLDTIPDEIGHLDGITELRLSFDSPQVIPETIGEIASLEGLELEGFGIKTLPSRIGQLKNLKKLTINLQRVTEIPDWISGCEALEELEFGGDFRGHASYATLPDLGELKNLKTLRVTSLQIEEIPEEFFNLPNLETFEIVNVKGVTRIPASLECMKSLKSLTIANCPHMEQLPLEITKLSNLKCLYISSLPAMKKLDGRILFMPGVKELVFRHCEAHIDMTEIESSAIRRLNICDISILKQLLSHGDKFTSLEKLDISDCRELEAIPDGIGELKALKTLEIYRSGIMVLPERIGDLKALETLKVYWTGIKTLPDRIGELQSLKTLEVRGDHLVTLPVTLSKLNHLQTLSVDSPSLSLSSRALPASIEKLSVRAESIDLAVDTPVIARTIDFKVISVTGSEYMKQFNGVTDFTLTEGKGLKAVDLCTLTSIERLNLRMYPEDITDVVAALTNLKHIRTWGYWDENKENSTTISPLLGALPCLTTLEVSDSGDSLLETLHRSKSLETITLDGVGIFQQDEAYNELIDILKDKPNLKRLSLKDVEMTNKRFEKLVTLTQLESLGIDAKLSSKPLDTIPESILNMTNLKSLSLRSFNNLTQVPDWIGELNSLENLELEDMTGLSTLPASLTNLPHLKRLSIRGTYPKELPDELNRLALDVLWVRSLKGHPIRRAVLDVLMSKHTRLNPRDE